MTLTAFERKTLEILRDAGAILTGRDKAMRPSSIGHLLWQSSNPETRKSRPSPQGLALFAGRFLGPLQRRKLVGSWEGYYITSAGLAALDTAGAELASSVGEGS